MSAGTIRDKTASTASLGTALGGPPASPNIVAVNGSRGTITMS
jgi:hypothetical protein